ncbi:MAG TPA: DUF2065 domain-containing protein [Steroidobacteraceae bacterium]|nr:DUF2065 domain-containing protein [Steroidobacteraceae bacterium]
MKLQWSDLLAAVAILLVLEGLLPFLNPDGTRRVFARLSQVTTTELRVAGFVSLMLGLLLLYLVRSSH